MGPAGLPKRLPAVEHAEHTILVIDDEPALVDVVRQYLRNEGLCGRGRRRLRPDARPAHREPASAHRARSGQPRYIVTVFGVGYKMIGPH
jgi:CheY-like chemotaxis protein